MLVTFENGNVSEEACTVVAQFLEHALVIVDRLYEEIVTPKLIIRSMALASISEGKDDGEGKDNNDTTVPAGGSGQAPAPPGTRGGVRSSSRSTAGKAEKNTGPAKNECAFEDARKENIFLPLTTANLNKLSVQIVRVFY
eukprot:CAMPEP_0170365822 /NCGR_PEP_ID=MMETSP0117_2-20130122/6102_1 /TAXON_ID=400756 /ORGANISM="Durinskia baltica, Strain CSIRO CS-38" /LENGTH=139 /DNA_ID=CAMNT_0010620395 /DNA_START=420 /DNA_END=839 /DNA_ORIENTATION=-